MMENVGIPRFERKNQIHKKLSELSKELHRLKLKGEGKEVAELEKEVDENVCKLFGLT